MADSPAPATADRIAALDGLRGIAIGSVVFFHYVLPDPARSFFHRLAAIGWSGVDLFFVLSGYLIGGILLRHRTAPRLIPVFFLRRALRILPLYFLTMAILLLKLSGSPGDWAPAWVYLVFGSNLWIALHGVWHFMPFSVTWSLAVEEQFYLVAPWLVRFTAEKHFGLLLALGCALPCVLRWLALLAPGEPGLAAHVLTPFRADGFAFGLLIAWALTAPAGRDLRAFLERHWRALLAVVVGALVLMAARMTDDAANFPDRLLYGYTALAAGFALILFAAVAIRPPWLLAILEFSPLRHLGRHAYFIYLWHPITQIALQRRLDPLASGHATALEFGVPLVLFLVTWLAAVVSWRLFEGPLVRLGQKFSYDSVPSRVPAAFAA